SFSSLMEFLRIHWPRMTVAVVVWLASAVLGAGCRTASEKHLLTISGPGWRVQQGQALWRPGKKYPELGGDLVLASDVDGNCVLQFTKMPLPLVEAQTTRTNWYINFAPRRLSFAGRLPPPTRFAWLYLPAALAGRPLPPRFRFVNRSDGGW